MSPHAPDDANAEPDPAAARRLRKFRAYGWTYPIAKRVVTTDGQAAEALAAAAAVTNRCYGYSDYNADVHRCIPACFRICGPLVRTFDEFLALCRAMPVIVLQLPRECGETPLGHTHDFLTGELARTARHTATLDDLLAPYRERIEEFYRLEGLRARFRRRS